MPTQKLLALLTIAFALGVSGCDCGGPPECGDPQVTILSPAEGAVIASEDDENASRAGVQVTVTASVNACIVEGSMGTLLVNGDINVPRYAVVENRRLVFGDVSLVKGDSLGNVAIKVSARDARSGLQDEDSVALRLAEGSELSCAFVSPLAGAILGPEQDADPATRGFQYDVAIQCGSELTGTPANLTVDGLPVPTAIFAGDTVTFSGLRMSEGVNQLAAAVTASAGSWSGQISVTVDTPDCEVRLLAAGEVFNLHGDPPLLVGRVAVADADGDASNGIQAAFSASTPDCQGGEAVLIVDGEALATTGVDATEVDFAQVTLPEGPAVQVLVEVRATGPDAPTGVSLPHAFYVDALAPAPVIVAPGATLGLADDGDGDPANGIDSVIVVEAPGLERDSGLGLGDGAAIAVLVQAPGLPDAVLTCIVGLDDCQDPESAERFVFPLTFTDQLRYRIEVSVSDPAGNVGEAAPVDVDVDTTARGVRITAPLDGAVVNLSTASTGAGLVSIAVDAGGAAAGETVTVTCAGATGPGTAVLDGAGLAVVAVDFAGAPCEGLSATCVAAAAELVSTPVTFQVDLSAPTLTIVSPAEGAILYDASVAVEVVSGCLEEGSRVTLTSGALSAGAAVSGGGAIVQMDLGSGTHALVASAADAAGNVGTSAPVSISVEADPPVVVFVTPSDGLVLHEADDASTDPGFQQDVVVQVANKPAGTMVELWLGLADGAGMVWMPAAAPVATVAGTLRATFPGLTFPEGAFTLRGVATAALGLRSAPKDVRVTVDTGRRVCNIVSPAHGASLGLPADANGDASDGVQSVVRVRTDAADGASVSLSLLDGAGVSTLTSGVVSGGEAVFDPVTFAAAEGSALGRNVLDAICDAGAANAGTALTAEVDVDLEAPAAVLVSPADGTMFNLASLDASAAAGFQVQVVVTASDPSTGSSVKAGAEAELTVSCGGTAGAPVTAAFVAQTSGVEARFRPTLVDQQSCMLSAVAVDLAGNRSAPATAVVWVDRVAPTLAIAAPLDGRLFGRIDDLSLGTPGFQNDVRLTYAGVEDGQSVRLFFSRASDGLEVESTKSPWSVGSTTRTGYTFPTVTYTPAEDDVVTVRATAVDAAGNEASATVTVSVDMIAPQVAITRPVTSDVCFNLIRDFDAAQPGIQTQVNIATEGVANDLPLTLCGTGATGSACSQVGFFEYGSQPVVSGSASFFVTLAEGDQELAAEVEDAAGNFNRSPAVAICADSVPPDVQSVAVLADTNGDGRISAAEDAAASGQSCFAVIVTGAEGQLLRMTTNNPAAGTLVGTAPVVGGTAQVCGALAEGGHQLTARVLDENGNPNVNTATPVIVDPEAVFTLVKDTIAPTLSITSPSATMLNAALDPVPATPDFELTLTASSDAEGRPLVFTVDGVDQGPVTVTGGSASLAVVLGNNADHVLGARVSDPAGNETTASKTVTVDTEAPVVDILSPADGSALNSNSLAVQLQVSGAAAGRTLQVVRVDTTPEQILAPTTVAATQPQTVTVNVPDGPARLLARVWDGANNLGQSAEVAVTVDTVGCSLVFTQPAGSNVVFNRASGTVTGSSLETTVAVQTSDCAGREVAFARGGIEVGRVVTDGTGTASLAVTFADAETGQLIATITDAASNLTVVIVDYAVDLTAPVITRTYPTAASVAYVDADNPTVGTTVAGRLRLADKVPGAPADADFAFDAAGAAGGQFTFLLDGTVLQGPTELATDSETLSLSGLTLPQDTSGTLTARLDDAAGNRHEVTIAVLVDVVPPAAPQVALALTDARRATVDATWPALGDDGASGASPVSVAVKWSTTPITDEATYASAMLFGDQAGAATSATLTPLPPINTYSIAVRGQDELDNRSPLVAGVNVVSLANLWSEHMYTGVSSSFFGSSMAPQLGDLNDDGYDDIVVGATGYDPPGLTDAGMIRIYYGGPDPANLTYQQIDGTVAGERLGTSISVADVSGDGIADLVVSSLTFASNQGRAFVFFGVPNTGVPGQVDPAGAVELRGAAGAKLFGSTVTVLGDVNGNGARDVFIAARSDGPNREGMVYAFFGRSPAEWASAAAGLGYVPASAADLSFIGATTDGFFGYRAGFVDLGDFDGDGKDDFGIPEYGPLASPNGKVFVYASATVLGLSSPIAPSQSFQTIGAVSTRFAYAGFGFSADATSRFAVFTDTVSSPPRATLHAVSPVTGVASTATASMNKSGTASNWGTSATYGDLTGDGFPDVVVGTNDLTYNRLDLFFNAGASPWYTTSPGTILSRAGAMGATVSAGDVNGDGKIDLIAGAPGTGSIYLWW